MILVDFLQFLLDNKAALIGGLGVLSEIIIICVNFARKLKANKSQIEPMANNSKLSWLLWSANPVNLFRKP